MLYYTKKEQYVFFEQKRYNQDKIPTWKEIDFIFEEKSLKDIGEKVKDKEVKIPYEIWKKLIKIFKYNENGKKFYNLRQEAIKKQPKIQEYLENGEIKTFEEFKYKKDKSIVEGLKDINVETYSSMYEFFQRGANIGNCGRTSRLMGIMFDEPLFYTGKAEFLKGTLNCEDGTHAWIETRINNEKYVIDTSTMLVIPVELKEKIGYSNTKEPSTIKDIIEYWPERDMYFNHYKELSKYPTKDKFSYESYNENIRMLDKEKQMEIEL